MAALLLPIASVIYCTRAAALLGCFQKAKKDALCPKGLAAQGQVITEGIGGSSRVCPSHLDLPRAKVEGFKEAQGNDLVNGCMTQLLPCGAGCFVSLILLFIACGESLGLGGGCWGLICTAASPRVIGMRNAVSFPLPFLGQENPCGTSPWLLVELLLPWSIFWGWAVELKSVSRKHKRVGVGHQPTYATGMWGDEWPLHEDQRQLHH